MPGLFGGGNDPSVDYSQSPEQQQMYQMFMRALGPMFGYEYTEGTPGTPGTGGSGFGGGGGRPGSPTHRGAHEPTGGSPMWGPRAGTQATPGSWEHTGAPWDAPQYPNMGYANLSPQEQQSMWDPYNAAADQLGERMGSMQGTARGGYTGAGSDEFQRFYADAGQQVQRDARSMFAPQAAAEFNTQLMPYQIAAGGVPSTFPNPVVNPGGGGMDPFSMLMAGGLTAGSLGWSPFG